MTKLVKVEGYDDLLKDPVTGVVVNVNKTAYEQHMAKLKQQQRVQKQLINHATEIQEIKSQLGDIKDLLTQLLNK
jgi:hypothetical protein